MGELFNVVWFHCNEQDLCSPFFPPFFFWLLLSIGVRAREEDEDRICRWTIYADEGSEFGAGHLT